MNSHQELFGGNIPQDVTGKQGENAIFIVYGLKQSDNTIKQGKDLCANFSALIRSMRNRFPEMQFSFTKIMLMLGNNFFQSRAILRN